MLTVMVSDTAQYYTGRAFGRRPLAPAISPKKTVEGAIGGFVFGTAAAGGRRRMVAAGRAGRRCARCSASTIVALGIAGDLFESMLKRSAGVKDSSALIPGHGGVLDRIDALLFAAPVYYIVLKYVYVTLGVGSVRDASASVDEAHRHPRLDRLDRPERAGGGRRASRSPAGRRPRRRRERRALWPSRSRATGRASSRWRPAPRSIGCAAIGAVGDVDRSPAPGRDGLVAVATHPDVDIVLCASSRHRRRSRRCSPRSSTARRSRSPTRKCSSWPAAS